MSIGPDNLFIPRVGFKVNLLVISTDRHDQHIQNWGGSASTQPSGYTAAHLKQHGKTYLLWTRSEPSHARDFASL